MDCVAVELFLENHTACAIPTALGEMKGAAAVYACTTTSQCFYIPECMLGRWIVKSIHIACV